MFPDLNVYSLYNVVGGIEGAHRVERETYRLIHVFLNQKRKRMCVPVSNSGDQILFGHATSMYGIEETVNSVVLNTYLPPMRGSADLLSRRAADSKHESLKR